ncbi:MAG TPA: hypothetical protein PKY59_20060, partial [Pyrinomonadaceae bacterium]|nr:hypothetical protein [Pyrinomonadaceae bacterium]
MINRIKRKWLPTTLAELAVWYANFALKLADYAGVLGISAATLAQVNQDNETVQWAARADGVSPRSCRRADSV